jgi:hypothetical protein
LLGPILIPHLLAPDTSVKQVEAYFLQDITGLYPLYPTYIREALAKEAVKTYVEDTRAEGLATAATEYTGDSMLLWPTYLFGIHLSGTYNNYPQS